MSETSRQDQLEPQINLTPEQIDVLKNSKIEIIEDSLRAVYCQYEEEGYTDFQSALLLDIREAVREGQIKKPIIFIGKVEAENSYPTFEETVDKLSQQNFFQDILDRNPNVKFSRSSVSAAKLITPLPFEDQHDQLDILHKWGGSKTLTVDFMVDRCIKNGVAIANLPDELQKRAEIYAHLESFYNQRVETEELAGEGSKPKDKRVLHESLCLKDEESFKKSYDEFKSINNDFLEQMGGYEKLRQAIIDYRDNFYPQKFQEMAELQNEINKWLKSLKVPE